MCHNSHVGDAWPMAFYFFESDMLFNPKLDLHVQVHNRKYVHLVQWLKGVVGSAIMVYQKGQNYRYRSSYKKYRCTLNYSGEPVYFIGGHINLNGRPLIY